MSQEEIDTVYRYIDVNPLRGSVPVFYGTSIPVSHTLEDLEKGLMTDDISRHHPGITTAHVRAAVLFAKHFPSDATRLLIALGSIRPY